MASLSFCTGFVSAAIISFACVLMGARLERLAPALDLGAVSLSSAAAGTSFARLAEPDLAALRPRLPAVPDFDALRPRALAGDAGVAKTSCLRSALSL